MLHLKANGAWIAFWDWEMAYAQGKEDAAKIVETFNPIYTEPDAIKQDIAAAIRGANE